MDRAYTCSAGQCPVRERLELDKCAIRAAKANNSVSNASSADYVHALPFNRDAWVDLGWHLSSSVQLGEGDDSDN